MCLLRLGQDESSLEPVDGIVVPLAMHLVDTAVNPPRVRPYCVWKPLLYIGRPLVRRSATELRCLEPRRFAAVGYLPCRLPSC